MPNIFDGFLKQVTRGDNIKDYQHAARLFVDNNYELAPKYTWLFHVYFDLNPELTTINQQKQIEAGMLVKSADLPRFRIDSKTYNNYNRPSIAQTKIRYEDINITFHDDSANVIRQLWFDYYNYYYRDMDNNYGDATGSLNPVYLRNNKQVLGQRALYNKFGYSPRRNSNISTQYIQAIRIYSLHKKRFSEYTLINPIITSYRHGSHANGQETTLENTMTISYESVLYAGGSTKVARGFADLHYDKSPSPLTPAGGGTNSLLGPGGIVNVLDDVITDGSGGNWGGAAFKLVRGYQKNKNVDLMNLAQGELTQAFTNILRSGASSGQLNFGAGLNATYIPYRGAVAGGGTGFQSALATQTTSAPGSVNSNGFNITAAASAVTGGIAGAFSLTGNPLAAASSNISGLLKDAQGIVTGADLNKVVDLTKDASNKLVATASDLIPTNAFTSAINFANEQKKKLADAEIGKSLQESLGKAGSFFTGTDAQSAIATFQTGTNNLIQQASGATNLLNATPFKNFQFAAGSQLSNLLGSNSLSAPSVAKYIGNTSTNPAQGT
jgi:hypothetical protein